MNERVGSIADPQRDVHGAGAQSRRTRASSGRRACLHVHTRMHVRVCVMRRYMCVCIVSYYVISCNIMLHYVLSCHVIVYYSIP